MLAIVGVVGGTIRGRQIYSKYISNINFVYRTIYAPFRCEMVSVNKLDARFLCQNARDFYRLPIGTAAFDNDQCLYFLAISIELSLKAYLRHTGMTDDETRQLVRHDLSKASRFATERGFDPPTLIEIEMIEVISRRYASGGFRRLPTCVWPRAFMKTAMALTVDLNTRVNLCLAG